MACYERDQVVEQPEAFLMRTALNLSIDAHRTRIGHGEEVELEEVVLLDLSPDTEAVILARERMARLGECLGRLSDKTRDIFLAHRIDGLTYQQIAQQHGLSISTVEKHVAKATLQLTTWMEDW
jgi:RNA polymerase sigma factor (sigma-70 family)